MSALAALQRDFVARLFAADAPQDPRARLYRDNALATLSGALAATYPVVRRLVGDAFFGEAARRHALAVPSRSGDLNAYGGTFAGPGVVWNCGFGTSPRPTGTASPP